MADPTKAVGKAGYGPVALLMVLFLVLGLSLVWLNIERVDIAYRLKRIQAELDNQSELLAKLEVQRDNLIAPHRMRSIATGYGLQSARSGQVRKVTK